MTTILGGIEKRYGSKVNKSVRLSDYNVGGNVDHKLRENTAILYTYMESLKSDKKAGQRPIEYIVHDMFPFTASLHGEDIRSMLISLVKLSKPKFIVVMINAFNLNQPLIASLSELYYVLYNRLEPNLKKKVRGFCPYEPVIRVMELLEVIQLDTPASEDINSITDPDATPTELIGERITTIRNIAEDIQRIAETKVKYYDQAGYEEESDEDVDNIDSLQLLVRIDERCKDIKKDLDQIEEINVDIAKNIMKLVDSL